MKPDENKRRHITVVGRSGMSEVNWDDIQNKPDFAEVATSGEYDDLENKPQLATVATSGSYNDLSNKPTIPSVPAMAIEELTFTLQGGTTKTVEFYTVPNYFYVEDISGSNNTLSIKKSNASAPTIEVFKSTDKMNWSSMGTTSTTAITATIPANGKLYLKANNGNISYNLGQTQINATGNHNVGGNILSLIYGDEFVGKNEFPSGGVHVLSHLFYQNTHIVNAEELILPSTLVNNCYSNMFNGCTSLTTAPALPATTLTLSCYGMMFYGCTSLTTAPVLPATKLEDSCYYQMFCNCSSLNSVTTYANNKSSMATYMTNDWLQNVSQTGDFYKLGTYDWIEGNSGIPSGWTVHTSL